MLTMVEVSSLAHVSHAKRDTARDILIERLLTPFGGLS